jgi:hypothetical protein
MALTTSPRFAYNGTMTRRVDRVVLTVPEIVDNFGVSLGAVRAWIAAGRLEPVHREGKGRGGAMYFARGEVVALLYGLCPLCGEMFKRGTQRQRFCSPSCRFKAARMRKKREPL